MFKKLLWAVAFVAAAGVGAMLPQKADAQIFPRVRNWMYWGPPAVRYYYGPGYYNYGGYYQPYWGTYRYYWYPY